MADTYYRDDYGRRRGDKPRRSLFVWLLDAVMTLLTLVVGAAMAVTYCVPYVNPSEVWFFPVLGLAAPAIYVATVILALYWIIRWRLLRAGVMVAIVAVGFFKVPLFYKPEFRRNYGEDGYDRRAFKVMTYNVRSFYGEDGRSSVANVLQLIDEQNPDVVCLQEFNARLAEESERFALLEEKYERTAFGRTQAPDSLFGAPLLILSKYRILGSGVVLTPNTSVWADLLIGDDTVRVFNNHLRSTAIKAADSDYITNRGFISDTAREVKIRSIVGRFRENSILRAEQVDSISGVVASSRARCIVCGDFNDTPMSYVYRTMAKGLDDAFSRSGSGYSHTFRGFFNTLRIDYVLCSDSFEPISYEVPAVDYSDHLPVVVRLKKNLLNN
ncbi:endonuclease/exonuclease/phosphatase family protein [uncultured Alistipes sp.]|uniref:endonuclease/exonuclease/phosphatase family protein n=1 Tax=uncultured Alistipes sp. TaxID=538949 RepID=UPI0025FA3092|nr:endonuclease/exonuclease/phosphatase family protein [uncultured Alistipes sp.]